MDSNFESYDKIFDSIKKKVYDNLIKEKSRTHDEENTSDESGTDDDLDWEFKENANAAVEELLEFRTDLPLDESLKIFTQVTSKRIKQASLAPVISQSEEELENKFYKELEKAEFFIAIQERFIQKSRLMVQENQAIDIGEFLADMMTEYENLRK